MLMQSILCFYPPLPAISLRLLCRWNIQCPRDQQLYLDIVEHNIEPTYNTNVFRNPVCVDYLRNFRDFGVEVSCGFQVSRNDLEPNRMQLEFRSNEKYVSRFANSVIRKCGLLLSVEDNLSLLINH